LHCKRTLLSSLQINCGAADPPWDSVGMWIWDI